jgi:hypothetical protein
MERVGSRCDLRIQLGSRDERQCEDALKGFVMLLEREGLAIPPECR